VRTLWDGRARTFSELQHQYLAARRALVASAIGPGSCVVSLVGNRPVFFSLFVACMDVGVALLPLNEATDAEVAGLVERSGAVAVVAERPLPLASINEAPLSDGVRVISLRDRSEPRTYGRSVLLKLTSGSTDLPKAAVAGESQLVSDGCHVIRAMGIGSADVNLAYIPLAHSYAIGNIVMPLIWQGTSVALCQMFNPSQFLRDASASGATVFPGVPFMFEQIQASEDIELLPAKLRLLITAGACIDRNTVLWFRERLSRKLHSFYGSSETGGISYDDSEDVSDPLHVGWPMPETTIDIKPVELLNLSGRESGRIFVSGSAVCMGYADGDDRARPSVFADGGFLTGDIGHFDGRGAVVLTGRVSPLVNVAGRKVDPAEVEGVLAGLPDVVEARVLGMSCDKRGQQIVAFVVRSSPALTPIAIRQLCAGRLSPYKIPRRFIFLDRLPVDARGKMDRRALEALASTL